MDPFPLAPWAPLRAGQEHAAAVDRWLGLRIDETESRLAARDAGRAARGEGQEIWLERGPATFLTPYSELREIVERLPLADGDSVVDVGAGYGRLAFVLARHRPRCEFVGLELVPERVAEANRVLAARGVERAAMLEFDAQKRANEIPSASTYFIYDFGSRSAIDSALVALKSIARSRPIAVVGRGRASRDAIEREHPWLSQVRRPEHGPRFSIYRSA